MTYSVNPPDLQESSRLASASAREVQTAPKEIVRLLCAMGDAVGTPDLAAAGRTAARRWGPAAEGLAREAASLARGVGGAGAGYAQAERAASSQFGARP